MRSGRKGMSVRLRAVILIILIIVLIAAGMAAERLGVSWLGMALALGCASGVYAGLWSRRQRRNARSDR